MILESDEDVFNVLTSLDKEFVSQILSLITLVLTDSEELIGLLNLIFVKSSSFLLLPVNSKLSLVVLLDLLP